MNIKKPTVIVDEPKMRRNIERMSEKARRNGVRLRAHFKTHQSVEVGEIIRKYGIQAITASSIDMAAYFAARGWRDITVAIPVNIRQIDDINMLAGKISLGVLVESLTSAEFLADSVRSPLRVWIEVDSGELRTGVNWKNTEKIEKIAHLIEGSEQLTLAGILTHAGQSYDQASVEAIEKVHRESISRMNEVRDHLVRGGFSDIEISVGDTPTCSLMDDFSGVDEIRPGNFVFNDLLQVSLGCCREEDIAVAVACPVIARYPERNELIIYGGGAHLATDHLMRDGSPYFGLVALPTETGWTLSVDGAWVLKIAQEHGTIRADREFINGIKVGDILMILPIHSCLTVNLHQVYQTVHGKKLTSFHYELMEDLHAFC